MRCSRGRETRSSRLVMSSGQLGRLSRCRGLNCRLLICSKVIASKSVAFPQKKKNRGLLLLRGPLLRSSAAPNISFPPLLALEKSVKMGMVSFERSHSVQNFHSLPTPTEPWDRSPDTPHHPLPDSHLRPSHRHFHGDGNDGRSNLVPYRIHRVCTQV